MIVTQPLDELKMQNDVMKYDPATGEQRPYPSHAEQWGRRHGHDCAWLFNPWSGERRDARDVGSHTNGRLIAPHGTLGSDLGVARVQDNTANPEYEMSDENQELPGMLTLAEGVKAGEWPHTMDAQVWTRKWLEITKDKPEITADEGAMIGWFANAIMAGYDSAKSEEWYDNGEQDTYLECDRCGKSMDYTPWHYSKGSERHLHACDECWPKVGTAPDAAGLVEALDLMVTTHDEGGWPTATIMIARAALAAYRKVGDV